MIFFYNISIQFYHFLIVIVSPFNQKAKQWLDGRKQVFQQLENAFEKNASPVIWFHAASLGEFEQGRPVIEEYKVQRPEYKILLTFFSPSGYEVRKNYELADWVFYLPLDTKRNAKKFISIIKPQKVVFIKYEFWYHYINELYKKSIPVSIISANFRKNQIFFQWYGKWYKKALKKIQKIFVQNNASLELLTQHGISNAEMAGDTRFDRVYKVAQNPQQLEKIENAIDKNYPTIIAGSSWTQEEDFLNRFILKNSNVNLILAPHEIHESNLKRIEKLFANKITRYSTLQYHQKHSAILIDTIGILSSIYQYGDVAFIGGGFGKGIHNVLEAATFGLPLIIGPNYQKFNEAVELIRQKGAFSVSNYEDFETILKQLIHDEETLKKSSEVVKTFVNNNIGATSMILKELTNY